MQIKDILDVIKSKEGYLKDCPKRRRKKKKKKKKQKKKKKPAFHAPILREDTPLAAHSTS
jgi:hypothetical protein